jgi:hypothetical protein
MFDARTKLAEQVVSEVRSYFGGRVYDAVIPRTVRLAEAPGFGKPITMYDPTSRGALAYRHLAQELLGLEGADRKTGVGANGAEGLTPMTESQEVHGEATEGREVVGGGGNGQAVARGKASVTGKPSAKKRVAKKAVAEKAVAQGKDRKGQGSNKEVPKKGRSTRKPAVITHSPGAEHDRAKAAEHVIEEPPVEAPSDPMAAAEESTDFAQAETGVPILPEVEVSEIVASANHVESPDPQVVGETTETPGDTHQEGDQPSASGRKRRWPFGKNKGGGR